MITETVPVYEWEFADGVVFGLGTEVEFRHWQSEGVNPDDSKLGKIICFEPASEDARRSAAWSKVAA
jgi:hypothetical protein